MGHSVVFTHSSKCQKYSPTESNKANDKTANRKGGVTFEPEQVLHLVRQEAISASKPILPKEECIRQYLEVNKSGIVYIFYHCQLSSSKNYRSHNITDIEAISMVARASLGVKYIQSF